MPNGRIAAVKITSIETLRTEEFSNVIWVRIHTDTGTIGLGETSYGAGAVEAQIHDTFAGRLLGRNPLHIEAIHRDMLNLPMAQSSTGVEYRAASAIDISLWDLFGKFAASRCTRCSAASAGTSSASTTPAPARNMSARPTSARLPTGTSAAPRVLTTISMRS